MKIMILGANGYLGRKLSRLLGNDDYDVVEVCRSCDCEYDLVEHIDANVNVIECYLKKNQVDWIINCVALYEKENVSYEELLEANYAFGMKVLLAAQRNGVKKFLTIDTSLPKEVNFYSMFKKQFAEFGQKLCDKVDITFVNVLLEMFYGEDEPENRFLVSCCNKMLLNEDIALTAGVQKRDIIYIDDVCSAIEAIINADFWGYVDIPVGSGQAISVRKIVEYMHEYINSQSQLLFGTIPSRNNEPDCCADVSVLNEIGWQAKYPWKNGLEHFCDEIRKKKV